MDRQLISPLLIWPMGTPAKLSTFDTYTHLSSFTIHLPPSTSRTQLERLTDALGVECGMVDASEGVRREQERAKAKERRRKRRREEREAEAKALLEDDDGLDVVGQGSTVALEETGPVQEEVAVAETSEKRRKRKEQKEKKKKEKRQKRHKLEDDEVQSTTTTTSTKKRRTIGHEGEDDSEIEGGVGDGDEKMSDRGSVEYGDVIQEELYDEDEADEEGKEGFSDGAEVDDSE